MADIDRRFIDRIRTEIWPGLLSRFPGEFPVDLILEPSATKPPQLLVGWRLVREGREGAPLLSTRTVETGSRPPGDVEHDVVVMLEVLACQYGQTLMYHGYQQLRYGSGPLIPR